MRLILIALEEIAGSAFASSALGLPLPYKNKMYNRSKVA